VGKIKGLIRKSGGKIVNRDQVAKLFDAIPDGSWLIEVNSSSKRSNKQNAYYWAAVIAVTRLNMIDMGYNGITADQVHDFFKGKFNSAELVNPETGELIAMVPQSTTGMNKEQFMEYIEKIAQWSAEWLQVSIPMPNQQYDMPY